MQIAKEVKVGFLGIATLAIFYFGFNFLKGSDLFATEDEFYVYYNDVMGLQASNPITFNGVTVGRVKEIQADQTNNRVKVIISVNKNIELSDKTVALLADADLLGSKVIKLQIPNGTKKEAETELKGSIEKGMITSVTDKLTPTLQKVDSLLATLNVVVKEFEHSGVALQTLMASATQTTNGVNGIVANNSKSLSAITSNAALLTANLNVLTNSLDAQIKPILAKTNTFADSLNAVQLGKTVNGLNASVASLQGILNEINNGNGTIGQLAQNDSLYVNLENTTASLNALLVDFKASPKRYVHFSLFGKKDKKK